eukprot:2975588-Pleurochrysis_carterae.AAC.1
MVCSRPNNGVERSVPHVVCGSNGKGQLDPSEQLQAPFILVHSPLLHNGLMGCRRHESRCLAHTSTVHGESSAVLARRITCFVN